SEWKTRYSNQNELNQMLERQVVILANQIEDTKLLLKDGNVSKAFADMTDSALERSIRMAQKEKVRLENEIREIELRIEQEAKVSFSNFTEIRNNVQVDKLQDSIFPI
ncbi:coiled-coil domain-containing protein 169-like, partial [Convolutriloba macropyga]|uniref:coiled-coil domain-containing protein 169-like n=1 Tax=Convolutriloba macropyga TaxID=536237 RepID=UPI003F5203B8